jgi:hypothetical protein
VASNAVFTSRRCSDAACESAQQVCTRPNWVQPGSKGGWSAPDSSEATKSVETFR